MNTCGIDLLGQKFCRLKVVDGPVRGKNVLEWICICDCGSKITVRSYSLRSGNRRSCGCERLEKLRQGKHCLSRNDSYVVWSGMMRRCYNDKTKQYHRYGGRGITVCEKWHTFLGFYADMGDKPSGMSIDRCNTNGNYEPNNCRWATMREQSLNRRNNVLIEYNNKTKPLQCWIDEFRLDGDFIRRRMYEGFTFEEAILIPKNLRRKRFHAQGSKTIHKKS